MRGDHGLFAHPADPPRDQTPHRIASPGEGGDELLHVDLVPDRSQIVEDGVHRRSPRAGSLPLLGQRDELSHRRSTQGRGGRLGEPGRKRGAQHLAERIPVVARDPFEEAQEGQVEDRTLVEHGGDVLQAGRGLARFPEAEPDGATGTERHEHPGPRFERRSKPFGESIGVRPRDGATHRNPHERAVSWRPRRTVHSRAAGYARARLSPT